MKLKLKRIAKWFIVFVCIIIAFWLIVAASAYILTEGQSGLSIYSWNEFLRQHFVVISAGGVFVFSILVIHILFIDT